MLKRSRNRFEARVNEINDAANDNNVDDGNGNENEARNDDGFWSICCNRELLKEYILFYGFYGGLLYFAVAFLIHHVIYLLVIPIYILVVLLGFNWNGLVDVNWWCIAITIGYWSLFALWCYWAYRYAFPFHWHMYHVLPGYTAYQTKAILRSCLHREYVNHYGENLECSVHMSRLFVKVLREYNEMCLFDYRRWICQHFMGNEVASVVLSFLPDKGDEYYQVCDLDMCDYIDTNDDEATVDEDGEELEEKQSD